MRQSIARLSAILLISLSAGLALGASPAIAAAWAVIGASGEVTVTAGQTRLQTGDLTAGLRLQAPFTVRTGSDGALSIGRGEDALDVGPDSLLEVPEPSADADGPVTRIRQELGSVLYQVQHRLKALFEVHTPYLVSVVKGTTFNILATADSTTVALIEGRLLVHTPDERAEVFLEAGQAAIRSAGDEGITVEDQHRVSAPVAGPVRIADRPGQGPSLNGGPSLVVDSPLLTPPRLAADGETGLAIDGASVVVAAIGGDGLSVGEGSIELGGTRIASGGGTLGVELDESSVELGGLSVGGTGLTPAVELGGASLDVGGVSLGLGLESGAELGDISIELGGASIGGTDLTPGLELGETSLQIGGIGLDAGAAPGLDLGDTSLELGGLTLGETALTPEIGLGETALNVGGSGIGLGTEIDLGLIDPLEIDMEIGTDIVANMTDDLGQILTDTTTTVLDPVGQLIGGLKLF